MPSRQQSDAGGLQPRRGQKDPALAAELNTAPRRRRTPPGGVERTIDGRPESEYEELPIRKPSQPPMQMEEDGALLLDNGEGNPDELPTLYEGDIVMFRLSYGVTLPDGEDMWPGMGAQTRVQPSEDPQDAVDRLRTFVIDELDYATEKAVEKYIESANAREEERQAALRQTQPRARRG